MTTWWDVSAIPRVEGVPSGAVKILLTGRPGSGKTTAVRRALAKLALPAGGFYTEEVREAGRRVGFRLVTLEGEVGTLADVRRRGSPRIGRYGVDLEVLDGLGVRSVVSALRAGKLVVLDEIGPMELLSPRFQEVVWQALEGPCDLLATIMRRKHPLADAMKARSGLVLLEITSGNRDAIVEEIVALLSQRGGA